MNWRLASVLFTIVSTVVMGVLLTLTLVLGYDSALHIVAVVLGGLLLALPVTYLVTKQLVAFTAQDQQMQ
jgi:hypothetical protein